MWTLPAYLVMTVLTAYLAGRTGWIAHWRARGDRPEANLFLFAALWPITAPMLLLGCFLTVLLWLGARGATRHVSLTRQLQEERKLRLELEEATQELEAELKALSENPAKHWDSGIST